MDIWRAAGFPRGRKSSKTPAQITDGRDANDHHEHANPAAPARRRHRPGSDRGSPPRRPACRARPAIEEAFFGGVSYDHFGTPLTDEVMARARKVDAILMGAVGGPEMGQRPARQAAGSGPAAIRKELDVYANLRPAFCFPALAGASALKQELVEGLDIMIVRELTSGVYFGQPKTIETLAQWRAPRRRYAELHDQRDPPRRRARLRAGARPHARRANSRACSPARNPTSWIPACSGARK